jgi:hypothetical protein
MARQSTRNWQLMFKPEETDAALELIGVIHGVRYTLTAVCPKCDKRHTATEVLAEAHFLPDETDFQCKRALPYPCYCAMHPMVIVTQLNKPNEAPTLCRFWCTDELVRNFWSLPTPGNVAIKPNLSILHSTYIAFGTETVADAIAHGKSPSSVTVPSVPNWRALVVLFANKLSPETLARILHVRPNVLRLALAPHLGKHPTTQGACA